MHQEIRSALLRMSDVERRKAVANAIASGDESFLAAAMAGAPMLSGMTAAEQIAAREKSGDPSATRTPHRASRAYVAVSPNWRGSLRRSENGATSSSLSPMQPQLPRRRRARLMRAKSLGRKFAAEEIVVRMLARVFPPAPGRSAPVLLRRAGARVFLRLRAG
jgi:hypothetical protein